MSDRPRTLSKPGLLNEDLSLQAMWLGVLCRQTADAFRPPETPSTICSKGFPQYLLADKGRRYFPSRAIQLKQCGSFPQLNTFGMFCGECSSPTYLQHLCCQRFSCSSSLHEGYDEPEILLDQIVKSVPKALTLDSNYAMKMALTQLFSIDYLVLRCAGKR